MLHIWLREAAGSGRIGIQFNIIQGEPSPDFIAESRRLCVELMKFMVGS